MNKNMNKHNNLNDNKFFKAVKQETKAPRKNGEKMNEKLKNVCKK